jgi:hypothetical protein
VVDDCERVIRILKTQDPIEIAYILLSYGKAGAHLACNEGGVLGQSSGQYTSLTGGVYYEKISSEPYYSFAALWFAGKLLRAVGTDEPINGWCSDGESAYYYTNGYPNTQVQQQFSPTTGVILCSGFNNATNTGINNTPTP